GSRGASPRSGSSGWCRRGSPRGITGSRRASGPAVARRDRSRCGSLNAEACEVFHKPRVGAGPREASLSAEHSIDTDVLVVGAGPGGSAAAYHLARHGIDVTIVERAAFPREKVCGDGLTPRGVAAIRDMGIDTEDPGFEKVIGLRVYTRNSMLQLPWPELTAFPGYGLVMP